ncbi:MAG: hypothetical protein PHR87_00565 [Sulfurospirillaceae bacterium]|nr:hypothetical protein [Sulfurospirillaceae bacterium]
MKTVKMIFVSIFLVLSGVSSAHAMGDREQGALLGAGAIILLGNLLSNNTTRYVESPVYYETRPRVVYREPYYERPRVVVIERPEYRHHHRDYYRYDDRFDRHYR